MDPKGAMPFVLFNFTFSSRTQQIMTEKEVGALTKTTYSPVYFFSVNCHRLKLWESKNYEEEAIEENKMFYIKCSRK